MLNLPAGRQISNAEVYVNIRYATPDIQFLE